jgi:hypothetical protein
MAMKIWACLAALAAASCSPAPRGRIVVAITIDWEGAYLSPDGLDALDDVRRSLGSAPMTHFVSAAYFTKDPPLPKAAATIIQEVRKGDELAVHLHAWRSLARASGIEPRLSPSFLTGTDKLLEFEDGDLGFDTDLDAYSVTDLRVLVRTSRRLLEETHLPVSRTFRAGGYLGTPKVLQAIQAEGFAVDCSATDHRQFDERKDGVLPGRLQAIWPGVEPTSQPWWIERSEMEGGGSAGGAGGKAPHGIDAGGPLLEMPIAALADYATPAKIVAVFEAAHARLHADPRRDVFVVVGFHQETAQDFAGRLREALDKIRGRREIADELMFSTVEDAAARARRTAARPSS